MAKKKTAKLVKTAKAKTKAKKSVAKKPIKAAPAAAAENNLEEELLEDQPEERSIPTPVYDDEDEVTESNW
jgi:hypothetical protein